MEDKYSRLYAQLQIMIEAGEEILQSDAETAVKEMIAAIIQETKDCQRMVGKRIIREAFLCTKTEM